VNHKEPRRTRVLRAIGCGGVAVLMGVAVVAWSWPWALAALVVFVGTAAIDGFLDAAREKR
jgi:hypothetical protein